MKPARDLPVLFFKPAGLSKSYVPAHTRRMKDGRLVQVHAHFDKRIKKGTAHAPAHGHNTDHLRAADRDRFDRMHGEQHLLHHYHGHALRKRIAAAEAELIQHHAEARAHREAGRQVQATASANKGLRVNDRLNRHRKELAAVDAKVAGLAAMKEALVAGSGEPGTSTDEQHDAYADKLGHRWKPQGEPYGPHIEVRPGTTDTQRATGRAALADLAARVRSSLRAGGGLAGADSGGVPQLLGARLYSGFVATGGNALVGQTVRDAHDLAHLAQVYRDPRFETFRAIFTDDQGRIVGESAYSNRLPGAVRLPEGEQLPRQISDDLDAFGATGFWIMHNHPSGRAKPSQADLNLTQWLDGVFKHHPAPWRARFHGHVIVDHNEYGHIAPDGQSRVIQDADLPAERQLQNRDYKTGADVPHPLLEQKITSPETAIAAARDLREAAQRSPALVITDHSGRVNVVMSIPLHMIPEAGDERHTARLQAWIRRVGRQAGAGHFRFLVVSGPDYQAHGIRLGHAVARNIFTDVIDADEAFSMNAAGLRAGPGTKSPFADRRPAKKLKLDAPATAKPDETPAAPAPATPAAASDPFGLSGSTRRPDELEAIGQQRLLEATAQYAASFDDAWRRRDYTIAEESLRHVAAAFNATLRRGDLKAANDFLAPLSLKLTQQVLLRNGFSIRAAKSKAVELADAQKQVLEAIRRQTDGFGLRNEPSPYDPPAAPDPAPDFDLGGYTESDIRRRADDDRRRQEVAAAAQREADRRQEADRARGDFVLTGSKRSTDQLAARGQGSLFGFSTRFGPQGAPLHKARAHRGAPTAPILFFRDPADRAAFLKAYIHGHYRTNKKTGKTVWVESYSDQRPEKAGQKAAFAHWQHRIEHVKAHLAHGLHREALHAFHDLSHDDAHRLATDLDLHDGRNRHASKKELMEHLREAIARHGEGLQAKVQAQRAARPEPAASTKPAKPKAKAPAPTKPQAASAPPAPAGPDPDDLTVDVAGQEVPFAWQLADAADLAPTEGRAANQYRDRTRAASEEQVQNIAGNLKFRLLADSPLMDYGAPVLAQDGKTIIGGNGRSLAIRRAYAQGKADDYREALQRKAARFGIDPAAVAKLQAPVLVRVLQKDVDIRQAAIASNEGGGARMSALEQARVDGERLGDLQDFYADDDGNLNTKANAPFIRRFLASVPVSQRPAFQGSDGGLSQEGITRLRNAVLHRAYGDSDLLSRMVESADPGQRNVLAALTRIAPTVAAARDDVQAGRLHDLDVAPDIVTAATALAKVREDKTFGSVEDYLSQQHLFGDGLSDASKIILRHFDRHLRSAKAMGEFLRDYYDAVRRIGDPNQGSMFGDPIPDKSTLLRDTHERANPQNASQAGLF